MSKLNNIIMLIVGESGCGKSSICDKLHDIYGYTILESYTTRKRRSNDERGHVFVTKEEYDTLPNKVATTCFDNNCYCATQEQVDNCDLYIIDPYGVEELKKNYHGEKDMVVIYVKTSMETRLKRMLYRGDSEDAAWERLRHDNTAFSIIKNFDNIITVNGENCIDFSVCEINALAHTLDCR